MFHSTNTLVCDSKHFRLSKVYAVYTQLFITFLTDILQEIIPLMTMFWHRIVTFTSVKLFDVYIGDVKYLTRFRDNSSHNNLGP